MLELVLCEAVTDDGMRFIAHTPCLSNLTLRLCHEVTDVGVAEPIHAHPPRALSSLEFDALSDIWVS
jgi:F-box/leucine-rich repeat protein 2/20